MMKEENKTIYQDSARINGVWIKRYEKNENRTKKLIV